MWVLVVIVAIIIIFFVLKSVKENLEYAAGKADAEETTKRFIEAVEKGTDPREVELFKVITKDKLLKDSAFYKTIQRICFALVENGCHFFSPDHYGKGHAHFGVYKDKLLLGYIRFCKFEWVSEEKSFASSYYERKAMYPLEVLKPCHIIQLFPTITIESKTPYSESSPEWLIMCGNILANILKEEFAQNLDDWITPEWVNKYPDAKKYVNVMFR